ncbi:WcbI family polysaccharide biosynthesis putative acetyltransferase [Paenibacillus sp. OSY-SE]|uniref:WcbI family polysaccharide biosynthesis putative acetyltransferase n=1 Tax=Paenibacillus sp. OSY-SE TaxID=1196323 RepID=UPI000306E6BA|nr:WcbI family polysaccharide biosynthesis putative acetyltransferase [Paenibacillus sp. OSY-SE]
MKNCIVFGNCHGFPIRRYLASSRTFQQSYQLVDVPPIQACNQAIGVGDHLLNQCDVFIYQRTSSAFGPYLSTEYLLSRLPERCKRISIGNAYFMPYYPQFTPDNKEPLFGYGDQNVIQLLQGGVSKERIVTLLSDEQFYSSQDLKQMYANFMADLRTREVGIDIPLTDFIERHYRESHLFCTVCHPRYHIIRYLAMNILERLGISGQEVAHVLHDVDFIDLIHPIYPSVIKHLDLRFVRLGDRKYTLGSEMLTFPEYISRYVDYHSHPKQNGSMSCSIS